MKEYNKITRADMKKKACYVSETGVGINKKRFKDIKPGDIIYYGNYEQGKNREVRPVEWIVLDVKGYTALLLSRYALLAKCYHSERKSITWETCEARKWLNSSFVQEVFSEEERKRISVTKVHNPDNAEYGTEGGNITYDRVFLLSLDEAGRYFEDNVARKCAGTDLVYEIGQAYTSNYGKIDGRQTVWWWLRSPGHFDNFAAHVFIDGSLLELGSLVNSGHGCVRPAFYLNLES